MDLGHQVPDLGMFGLQVGRDAVLLKRRGRDRSDRADDRSPSERFPQRARRSDLRGQAEHVVDLRGTAEQHRFHLSRHNPLDGRPQRAVSSGSAHP